MRPTRRTLTFGAVAALLLGSLAAGTPAQASLSAGTPAQADPAVTAAKIAAKAAIVVELIGDAHTAGAYWDVASASLVVNVTDDMAAAKVRAAGATPKLVTRSSQQLAAVMSQLDSGIVGTAWSVDPVTNQVVVDVDRTVDTESLSRLKAAVAQAGGGARINRVAGQFELFISGGDAIYGGGNRCSLGFNVRRGSTYYFLTAGHCTNLANTWFANSARTTELGDRAGSSFPHNDYGIVRYTNSSIAVEGTVGDQDINSAGNAFVGQSVTRRGSTTGTRSGTVTGLNATVHYPQGTVRQMIRTNVCAEGGDSGGPLYSGSIALGLTSGGSGDCQTGGTTFFQPVTEALKRYKVYVF